MSHYPIIIERCRTGRLSYYPIVQRKILRLQKIVQQVILGKRKYYNLGNLAWNQKLMDRLKKGLGLSKTMNRIILHVEIHDNYILNPPLILRADEIPKLEYIDFDNNKLMILNSLWEDGSHLNYYSEDNESVYSEHLGFIKIKDYQVNRIIIAADTDRIDDADPTILMPKIVPEMELYSFMFHTHPLETKYAGRIHNSVIYEFPSPNDIRNFMYYYRDKKLQASIVIAPEGMYVIRPVFSIDKYLDTDIGDFQSFMMGIQDKCVKKILRFQKTNDIHDEDFFHEHVSNNIKPIKKINQYLSNYNVFIDYYPRIKKDNKWRLREFSLQYIPS